MKRRNNFFLLFFLAPTLMFAQQYPSKYAFSETGDRVLKGKLVFCIKEEFRAFCSETQTDAPGVSEALGVMKTRGVQKMFPALLPPSSPTDEAGQKMADLSLIYVAEYEGSMPPLAAARTLMGAASVAWAEPWYVQETFYQPNDFYADTAAGFNFMWHLGPIQARQAWDIQKGNKSVVVGIVDSGTDGTHPDLQGNIAINSDDPVDGMDNDNDGYVDNRRGWDFGGDTYGSVGDNDPSVGNVHGLWVTGIVGATADNAIGVPGLCFNCGYLPIKAAPDDSIGLIAGGYQGIIYAVEQGASVVNCSWGGSTPSRLGEDVINYATVNKKAAIIAAAGNNSSDWKYYPAAYPRVISVANTGLGDTLYDNSTFNYTVDLGAPGIGIWSTFGNAGYWAWGGTSASAPVVAAAVALTQTHFPGMSGFEAGQRVRVTADDIYQINSNRKDKIGNGRLNMYRALSDVQRPSVRMNQYSMTDADGNGRFIGGDTLLLQVNWVNHLAAASNLSITLSLPSTQLIVADVVENGVVPGAIAAGQSFSSGQPFRIRLKPGIPVDYTLNLKLTYVDASTGYTDFEYIEYRVNPSYINVTENNFHTTVNSQGNFGFNDFISNLQGIGARYRDYENALFEGGFLAGISTSKVSDRIRSSSFRDNDFGITDQVYQVTNSSIADFESVSSFNDRNGPQPIGINVTQRTFAWRDDPFRDFVIMQYLIRKDTGAAVSNLYAGLFADWDIAPYFNQSGGNYITRNACDYSQNEKMVYAFDQSGEDPNYYGIALLSQQNMYARAATSASPLPFSTAGKYQSLTTAVSPASSSAGTSNGGTDIMHFISGGPVTIDTASVDTFAFALIGAASLPVLSQHLDAAEKAYYCYVQRKSPQLAFLISDTLIKAGQQVQFLDPNVAATDWQWSFGDGSNDTLRNPMHVFGSAGNYVVTLSVSDGYCTSKFTKTLRVQTGVGIEEPSSARFRVYPNPATAFVRIEAPEGLNGAMNCVLHNLMGQSLRRVDEKAGSAQMSLEGLAPGLYLLEIEARGLREYHSLVVE